MNKSAYLIVADFSDKNIQITHKMVIFAHIIHSQLLCDEKTENYFNISN